LTARRPSPSDHAVVELLWLAIINIGDDELASAPPAASKLANAPTSLHTSSKDNVMAWREARNQLDTA